MIFKVFLLIFVYISCLDEEWDGISNEAKDLIKQMLTLE
jgi:hypothetical protein